MNKKVFLVVMAGLLCSKGVFGQEPVKNYAGDETVVTATKTLNSIRNTGGSSVTVITAEEIKRSGQQSVEEVIKGTAGIDVASNGGPGTVTSVYLRGADPKNTLVLLDGVPLNDPADGTRAPNMSNITVDNIERIEIVRGAVSFLYGSNASAGVINIITKKGSAKAESFASVDGGSFHTYKLSGGTSGQEGPVNYSLGVSRLKSDGFSAADEKNRWLNPTGKIFEKDGYENSTLSGNIGLQVNEKTTLETVLRYTNATVAYDTPGADKSATYQDSKQFIGRVALKMNYQPLLSTLYFNVNNQDRRYMSSGAASSTFNGYLYETGWQGDYTVSANNTLSAGLNAQHESMVNENFGLFASTLDKSIASNSIFLQDQWHLDALMVTGGVRYEDNEKFGSKITYRAAPSYTIGSTILKFSYGTGFRAPSLYELYSPYGNTALKAESSVGWDAGFEEKVTEKLKLGATWFRMDYGDRIAYNLVTSKYDQVQGKTKTLGVESFLEWRALDPLFLACNYTYTSTADALGAQLLRRPKNKVGMTASYKVNSNSTISTNMQYVGSRQDSGARNADGVLTGKLPAYFLLNMTASTRLSSSLELYGRIDNVFDRYYEEAWGYATPGRSAYAGLKVTF